MIQFRAVTFFCILTVLCLSVSQATAQRIAVSVRTAQLQIPVLKHRQNNPVLRIKATTSKRHTLLALRISTEGTTDLKDLDTVRVFYTGADPSFSEEQRYGAETSPDASLQFNQKMLLEAGTHYFWVSYQIDDQADLLHFVDASLVDMTFQEGSLTSTSSDSTRLKLGVALRQHYQDSVHTHRIPGLATTRAGTLLAIYDARWNSARDLQGDIDIGLSRSADGGNSWEPLQVVLDQGQHSNLPEKFNGVSDACILADTLRGVVYVAGLWMHGVLDQQGQWTEGLTEQSDAWEHQWKNRGSQPGFGKKETSQFLITQSNDDGQTWSEPVNVTQMGKEEGWWLWAPAPGRGIVLADGTLILPTQGRDATGLPFSTITYSQDQGQTWVTGTPAYTNTTECAVVALSDGGLMLNMRDNRNRSNKSATNGRAVYVTYDLGQTWHPHPTHHGALPEPTCMASLHRHTRGGKSILLFSNPNSRYHRDHITVKVSLDEGMSWPEKYWLLLDEQLGRGYSCLTSIDENTIGIVYESSQADLVFQQISLDELINR